MKPSTQNKPSAALRALQDGQLRRKIVTAGLKPMVLPMPGPPRRENRTLHYFGILGMCECGLTLEEYQGGATEGEK